MVGAPSASAMNITGVTLALGAALLYALYLPELHRAQIGIPAGVSMFYLLLGVFIAFSIASIASGQFTIPRSPATWSYLALLSIVGTIIAFMTLISGLRTLGPVRTSIISTIEPFFTAALGALLLGETLTVPTIVGGGMIASAVVLLEWTGRPPATTPAV